MWHGAERNIWIWPKDAQRLAAEVSRANPGQDFARVTDEDNRNSQRGKQKWHRNRSDFSGAGCVPGLHFSRVAAVKAGIVVDFEL